MYGPLSRASMAFVELYAKNMSVMLELMAKCGNRDIIPYFYMLEMIQAFGDIFKNSSPQHRWLF